MQRSSAPAIISTFNAWQDKALWTVKETIEQSYWASNEGVFEFQFISDNMPLTNTISPHYFQLIRHTPDYLHDAFQTLIQGRLNADSTIEYGGGRLGKLINNNIIWDDGTTWNRVSKMPVPNKDILDLSMIQAQATLDSSTLMDGIYKSAYLY